MGIFKAIKKSLSFTKHIADDAGQFLSEKSSELYLYAVQKNFDFYDEETAKNRQMMYESVPENQWEEIYKKSKDSLVTDYNKTKKRLSQIINLSIENNNILLYKNARETEEKIDHIYKNVCDKFVDAHVLFEYTNRQFEKLLNDTKHRTKQN